METNFGSLVCWVETDLVSLICGMETDFGSLFCWVETDLGSLICGMGTDFGSLFCWVEIDLGSLGMEKGLTSYGVETDLDFMVCMLEKAKGWPNSSVSVVCLTNPFACDPAGTAGCAEDCDLAGTAVCFEM